ncbi:FAD-dependent oxidoreductase [Nocardia sp. R7R-8]|uniref:FAD-dependent oxidoreductase n=1 Tax=Nocardia sp. R7R-8 TaxID=3459304 RepID=UPI00403DA909
MSKAIAIVGANVAGGRAAQALRRAGYDGEVHLFGAEAYPPYDRPPLSKEVLLEHHEPEKTYLQTIEEWSAQDIQLHLGTPITRIDTAGGALETSSGKRLKADKVLLATGGAVRRLAIPGVDLPGVEYLRTIDDAVAVRDRLRSGGPIVVVGGGFIGAEVAACARKAGCDVTLIEVEDVPLWRVLGRQLGGIVTQYHRDAGVRVLPNTALTSIEGTAEVSHVVTTSGERIEATLVLIGIGLIPATELAADAGIQVTNGVAVDEFGQTSNPAVFAAGDVAYHPNAILGHRLRLEHWQNAQNQGIAVARTMAGAPEAFREVPWFWSDQYDLSIQMSGHPHPDDHLVVRGDPASRSFSAFFLREGRLRSTFGINRPRDVKRTLKYIESGQLLDPAQLRDESTDLRNLSELSAAG